MKKVSVRYHGVSVGPDGKETTRIYVTKIDPDGRSGWEAVRIGGGSYADTRTADPQTQSKHPPKN